MIYGTSLNCFSRFISPVAPQALFMLHWSSFTPWSVFVITFVLFFYVGVMEMKVVLSDRNRECLPVLAHDPKLRLCIRTLGE